MRKTLTLGALRALLLNKEITPREAVMLCRDYDESFFSHSLHERALARAEYAAERIAERSTRDTTGIPIAIEDTLCMAALPTPFGGASYDATVVRKLDGYGALIVGALRGAGMAATGSAAAEHAVRTRLCFAALGASALPTAMPSSRDQAPVTALKPSFGTVSRYGLAVAAPSLKQVGIVALNARDAATMMDAISDFDPFDPAMLRPNCYDYAQDIGKEVRGLTVAAATGTNFAPLGELGVQSLPFQVPGGLREIYDAVEAAEAVFTLANVPMELPAALGYRAVRELGLRVLREEGLYAGALAARGEVARALRRALASCDALLVPLALNGEPIAAMAAELSGLPCIVRGEVALIGRPCDETTLLRIASALEGGTSPC